jgi:mannose/fructose-specific phosphotransferase system component IIA
VTYKPSMLTLSIWPNPVADELHVLLQSAESETFTIALTDMTGRMVYNKSVSLSNETKTVNVKMSRIAGTVFLAKISKADGKVLRVEKIIKL